MSKRPKNRPVIAAKPAPVRQPNPGPSASGEDIVLCPRDGLFLKDGREWGPAGASWAHSLDWPAPSTILGALRTATGRRAEQEKGITWTPKDWKALECVTRLASTVALRRPVAATGWNAAHRVWPVPADALFLKDDHGKRLNVLRLEPRPATPGLGSDDNLPREALWRPRVTDPNKPARPPAWWCEQVWVDWLATPPDTLPWNESDPLSGLALPRHVQVHVGIDRLTGAAADEILFAHDVVESLDGEGYEWAIGCQFTSSRPEDGPGPLATIGGDRRLARIERARDLFGFPAALAEAFRKSSPEGIRLTAVTPAAFTGGWCPPDFTPHGNEYRGKLPGIADELILRACMVPRAGQISGWDMARNAAKATTRLVPPGAVYHFVKSVKDARFTEADAKQLWLIALGNRCGEGFGRFAPGLWNPKESGS